MRHFHPLSIAILRINSNHTPTFSPPLFIMANVKVQIAPYPSRSDETAVIQTICFANTPLTRYWSPTPAADVDIQSADQIHPDRLRRASRDHAFREIEPGNFVLYAIADGVVAGFAIWGVPKPLWRSETLWEVLYRNSVAYKNKIEDWLYPAWWIIPERYKQFKKAQMDCFEKFTGDVDNIWYLKVLCVHPNYQRKGIGTVLVNWGLDRARARGQKVYLEASEFGKGLYRRLGFEEVGTLEIEDGEFRLETPCMLWDPATAPKQAPQVG